jgi:prepilin-type processing-associated H-X9-DG protein
VPASISHGFYPSLLPHLDEGALAAAYRWDVSYADSANLTVASTPIAVLNCPSSVADDPPPGALAGTNYGPVDVNASLIDLGLTDTAPRVEGAISGNGRAHMNDITDGTANTLLVVEAPAVNPWASPCTMVSVRTIVPGPAAGPHRGGVNVCTADGAVHFLRAGTGFLTVARLATRAGGEVASVDW